MNRIDAVIQYENAQKLGKKYYNACVSRGEDPYPKVLDEIVSQADVSSMNIGLVEIPIERIVGTFTGGRKNAFAGNFMPLMPSNSEFGQKWMNLCEAHLSEGITDPIKCYEYLGEFYIQEGHKRVSVLKSFGAADITGMVTRLVPPLSDDPKIRLYHEFIQFYKTSRLYIVNFSQPGNYAKLQAAMGFAPGEDWTEAARRSFSTEFARFSGICSQINGEKLPLTDGDIFLEYLKVHPYSEIREQTDAEIRTALSGLWPDLRLLASGEPIAVSTEPEEKGKNILVRILGTPKLHAAFIYDHDPKVSPWAASHDEGRKYLAEQMGSEIEISTHISGENPADTLEYAVKEGANVIFATSPTLIDPCRRLAAKYKNIAVFNCSLSLPYAGVRSYYCRIYEGKFIAGAIAGAMAGEDRIGYVESYPIMGAIASVNAFALGARLTNPRAEICLKWSCLPGDPFEELSHEGVSVISNRGVAGTPREYATVMVLPDGQVQNLATPLWNWGIYYEKTTKTLLNNGIESLRDSSRAVTDWWGLRTGLVTMEVDESLPDGMKMLAGYLSSGIIGGDIDPFFCPIRDQKGEVISDGHRSFSSDELMRMDWLCDNVDGSIPGWDELLPQSRNLVRLLGIYRESIPPEPGEQKL